jgi:hypothetical protein
MRNLSLRTTMTMVLGAVSMMAAVGCAADAEPDGERETVGSASEALGIISTPGGGATRACLDACTAENDRCKLGCRGKAASCDVSCNQQTQQCDMKCVPKGGSGPSGIDGPCPGFSPLQCL